MSKFLIVCPYGENKIGAASLRVSWMKQILENAKQEVKIVSAKDYISKLQLILTIVNEKPKVVIGVSPPLIPQFFALIGAKACGAKFILDAKDDGQFYSNPKKLWSYIRYIVYRFSDRLLFLTDADRLEAHINYGIIGSVIPNGTDCEKVYFSEIARKHVRGALSIGKNEIVLVYSGTIVDEQILELIQNIGASIKFFKLRLLLLCAVSKNDLLPLEEIKKEIKKQGIDDLVFVYENVPYEQIYKYYSASDIGILSWPAKYPTSVPTKVFDYCAANLLVIGKGVNEPLLDLFSKHRIGRIFSSYSDFVNHLDFVVFYRHFQNENRKIAERFFDRKIFNLEFLRAFK